MTLADSTSIALSLDGMGYDPTLPEAIEHMQRRSVPRVLSLTGGVDGSLIWRVWWQCAHLSSHGFVHDYVRYEDLQQLYPLVRTGRYNMLQTPRFVWWTEQASEEWLAAVRQDHLGWIYESDDDLWSPEVIARQIRLYPPGHERADPEKLEWERSERIRLVKFADGITVSSEPLRQIVQAHTSAPVYVLENYVDVAWYRKRIEGGERHVPPLSIGWMGGQRDEDDLLPVAEAWGRIARRYPEVNFVLQGYPAPCMVNAVPRDRLYVLPWATVEAYPAALVNIDIACCAVSPAAWNWSKSPIKWFEYTLAGAPCVVSPTLYGPWVQDGTNALVAETPNEWEDRLGMLIESAELRASINAHAVAQVEYRHSLGHNWWRWVLVWSEILQRAQELGHV